VVDLTSIREVDAGTAERLFRLHRSAGLLGAEVVFSGIQPAVIHSLVASGLDGLRWPPTFGTCDQALQHCLAEGLVPRVTRRRP
jgi:anti-anti-sigma regulatory factor